MSARPAADTSTTSVLELLALPKTSRLSDPQRRGTACVWCAVTLAPGAALDLGPRPDPAGGQMFPRGCQTCVRAEARRIVPIHARACGRCVRSDYCDAARGLRRLALEGRR